MLQFMRKYQKFLFGIVAVVIIASFCFFGTYGTITSQTEVPDHRIGTLIDDSPMMQQEVELLVRFLATSPDDRQLFEKGQMPNLFNDGVIQKEFLQTGFIASIAKPWFSEIASEMQERAEKIRAYRHYVHPQAPFISAEAILSQFFPSMRAEIEQLKSSQMNEESLKLLSSLYLQQREMPSDLMRRILMYQEQQYASLSHDPRLENADLNLFGFQTLEDWLGPKLMRSLAQVILNGAAKARTSGYYVSEEEARRSLQANFFAGIKKSPFDRDLSQEELKNLYHNQVRLLHYEENKVVALWQKVLQFRKMMHDAGSSVALDAAAYQEFSSFAREKLRVSTYGLPESLRMKDFRDLLKLQTYLDAVSLSAGKKPGSSLNLPQLFASPEDMLRRCPELAEYRFSAEIKEVSFEDLASRISLKQVYDWEMEEKNWKHLSLEYPSLAEMPSATVDERYAALEKMAPDIRLRMDKTAKEAIVRSHSEWVESALAAAEKKTVEFGLRQRGGKLPFIGVTDRNALYAELKKAPLKEKEGDRPVQPLRMNTDGYHHYEVTLLGSPSELTLLTFAEASKDGTLDALLDKKLEEAYPDLRKKNTSLFQEASGAWKPFAEVKDYVGACLYADLLRSIASYAETQGVDWPDSDGNARFSEPLGLYAQYRLQSHVQKILEALREGESEEGLVATGSGSQRISEQWKLIKQEKEMTRSEVQNLHLDGFFAQPIPSWSAVTVLQKGQWGFIRALEKKQGEKGDVATMVKTGQEHLAKEAKRLLLQALLTDIATKKAIVFTEPKRQDIL